jgi:hypothetical protein
MMLLGGSCYNGISGGADLRTFRYCMISSEHRNQRHCIMFADKSYVSYSYYNYFGAPQTLMSLCSGLYCLLLMPTPKRVHN